MPPDVAYRYFCHVDGYGSGWSDHDLYILRISCSDEQAAQIDAGGSLHPFKKHRYPLTDADKWVAEGMWIEGDVNGPFGMDMTWVSYLAVIKLARRLGGSHAKVFSNVI